MVDDANGKTVKAGMGQQKRMSQDLGANFKSMISELIVSKVDSDFNGDFNNFQDWGELSTQLYGILRSTEDADRFSAYGRFDPSNDGTSKIKCLVQYMDAAPDARERLAPSIMGVNAASIAGNSYRSSLHAVTALTEMILEDIKAFDEKERNNFGRPTITIPDHVMKGLASKSIHPEVMEGEPVALEKPSDNDLVVRADPEELIMIAAYRLNDLRREFGENTIPKGEKSSLRQILDKSLSSLEHAERRGVLTEITKNLIISTTPQTINEYVSDLEAFVTLSDELDDKEWGYAQETGGCLDLANKMFNEGR